MDIALGFRYGLWNEAHMRYRAAFIGIDRFSDPTIRNLSGCRRDALALHALFADTLPSQAGRLIVDEEATRDNVLDALNFVLDQAEEDDIAVVSFSGHGSPDHYLVVHDSQKKNLDSTAISMGELALRFKKSKARVILCVLDCCFSGGAPARVLEDVPLSRDLGVGFEEIAGEGRILIAAANIKEVAYERNGHGLLTNALLAALQSSQSTVSIISVMDGVLAQVRADAAAMRKTQTPVFLGHIEGGLVFPAFKKGLVWQNAFPKESGRTFSGNLTELSVLGFSPELLKMWEAQLPNGLNPLQITAINSHSVLDGGSLLVIAPTGAGKTFVGEIAAARAISNRQRAVFLFPYKALTNEKFEQFRSTYDARLGFRTIRCTADSHDQVAEYVRGKYDIALFTYEMFLSVTLGAPWTLDNIGVIVLDEAQFLADEQRGVIVELILTHLIRQREYGINPQLIVLSAVIGNVNGLPEWLQLPSLRSDLRPIPLVEGVLDRTGKFRFRDTDGKVRDEQLLLKGEIIQRTQNQSAQDVLVPLVAKLLRDRQEERVLIFRNIRGKVEGCASYLAKDLCLNPIGASALSLPSGDPSAASGTLAGCIRGGVAFHNTNLSAEERLFVEGIFRDKTSDVRVLVATTTVAAGINTPASTVIIAEQEFVGEDGRQFTVSEYKNMAGRAGRPGYSEFGRSIILADHKHSLDHLFQKYVLATPESLRSSFTGDKIDTWVLRLLTQVESVLRVDVAGLLASTYGGYLEERRAPGWKNIVEARILELVGRMLELGLLEQHDGYVQLTLLGKVCGRSSLSFSSAMQLVRKLKTVEHNISAEELLLLIQALPESDTVYTPLQSKGAAEDLWPREVSRIYGRAAAQSLQSNAGQSEYRGRCKRVVVLHHWVRGTAISGIEALATRNPFNKVTAGNIRQFADSARFHLRSAYEIASVILIDHSPCGEAIDCLVTQLEFGVPESIVGLARALPNVLGRAALLALNSAGVTSPETLWQKSASDLVSVVGEAVALKLEQVRPR